MARVKFNPFLFEFTGNLGGLVLKKMYGQYYASQMPEAGSRKFSRAQKEMQDRFRKAVRYAREVFSDPEARARYEKVAKARRKPVLSIMIADYLKPPTVDGIDLTSYAGARGGKVRIRATDDFQVVEVRVVLSDGAGTQFETGLAARSSAGASWWVYVSTVSARLGPRCTLKQQRRTGLAIPQQEVYGYW